MNTEKKIALIIDCDNAKADAVYGIMEELSKFGEVLKQPLFILF